jgi:hypothetical protein
VSDLKLKTTAEERSEERRLYEKVDDGDNFRIRTLDDIDTLLAANEQLNNDMRKGWQDLCGERDALKKALEQMECSCHEQQRHSLNPYCSLTIAREALAALAKEKSE